MAQVSKKNKNKILFNLKEIVVTEYDCCVVYRVSVLADNGTMAPSELRLNSETFSWLSRIPPILDEHKQLITQSRREAEEGLKVHLTVILQHFVPSKLLLPLFS